jgi:hypothetical protein
MTELSGLTASDVREAMGLRDEQGWNRAWRVFYDLEKQQPATERTEP